MQHLEQSLLIYPAQHENGRMTSVPRSNRPVVPKRDRRQLYSLHIAFTILAIQESAWVITPLLFCLSVALQLTLAVPNLDYKREHEMLASTVTIYSLFFSWYLLAAAFAVYGLKRLHDALQLLRPALVNYYLAHKIGRMIFSCIVAIVLLLMTGMHDQLHLIIYLLLETAVGGVALDVAWRTRCFLAITSQRVTAAQPSMQQQTLQVPSTTSCNVGGQSVSASH